MEPYVIVLKFKFAKPRSYKDRASDNDKGSQTRDQNEYSKF